MPLRVEDYAGKLRDTKVERDLAGALRQVPEEERFLFIQELLANGQPACPGVALDLVRRCLSKRALLESILRQGFSEGDASTIQYWLEAVVAGLGFRRVVKILAEKVKTDPEAVIRAHYWLPKWLPPENRAAVGAFHRLESALAEAMRGNSRWEHLLGEERRQRLLRTEKSETVSTQ